MKELTDARQDLRHISILGAIAAFGMLFLELYYSNYLIISQLGWSVDVLDHRVFLIDSSSVFDKGVFIRSIMILVSLFIVIYPSNAEVKRSLWSDIIIAGGFILAFFVCLIFKMPPYPNYVGQACNMIFSPIILICVFHKLFILSNHFNKVTSLKGNDALSDGFEQNTKLIISAQSVNLKYNFSHLKKRCIGFINVINPYRASYVIGTPGSGKSYAVLEEYIRQLIGKGFCAVIYDYKDPTLSKLTYNYYLQQRAGGSNHQFRYLSFQNINKTYRCNPLTGISTAAEALDIASVMLVALNKSFATKQGEFFVESAGKFTALNIYVLGVVYNGAYQSLPHVISMLCRKATVSFPAIKIMSIFYPDMKNLFAPFEEAYDNDVVQQLQGQLASAQIGLGSMSDAALAFVMTEDKETPSFNVDLKVNDPTNPAILCIGNDPVKDKILGLANSVYLSRLSKIVNTRGIPCLFAVDELPTVFINGLDNLIATARSNKIAVLLGFQDFTQLIRDYGDKIANAIINTIGNVFVGAVKGETARRVSDSFGEKKMNKHSKSINEDGQITTSIAEHKEKKIPIDIIEELSQGEFVGRVSDEVETPIRQKVFYGNIEIDPKLKASPNEIPDIRSWDDLEIKRNLQLNLITIDNEVSEVLATLNELSKEYKELKAITYISKGNNGIALERYIDDPSTDNMFFICIWLEKAYYILSELEGLELKDDILTFQEKLGLLLRDLWNSDMQGIKTVLNTIEEHGLYEINDVQVMVERYSDQLNTLEGNYDSF